MSEMCSRETSVCKTPICGAVYWSEEQMPPPYLDLIDFVENFKRQTIDREDVVAAVPRYAREDGEMCA